MLHQIRNHIDACELAFRIVCGSSPHGPPPHSSLHTYVGAVYALDPATRLDQENAPTECELKAHEMKRRKVAALDPGCNAAVTSPSKREAAYDAKIDGWMREILPSHEHLCIVLLPPRNLSVLQNASEPWTLRSRNCCRKAATCCHAAAVGRQARRVRCATREDGRAEHRPAGANSCAGRGC